MSTRCPTCNAPLLVRPDTTTWKLSRPEIGGNPHPRHPQHPQSAGKAGKAGKASPQSQDDENRDTEACATCRGDLDGAARLTGSSTCTACEMEAVIR